MICESSVLVPYYVKFYVNVISTTSSPGVMEQVLEENVPRRSPRRSVLAAIDNTTGTVTIPSDITETVNNTPQVSADEFIIEHRGRRKKPITWSPVEYNKMDILGPPRDRTPERAPQPPDISLKIRRRLTMSPRKDASSLSLPLGTCVERKLKALSSRASEVNKRRVTK